MGRKKSMFIFFDYGLWSWSSFSSSNSKTIFFFIFQNHLSYLLFRQEVVLMGLSYFKKIMGKHFKKFLKHENISKILIISGKKLRLGHDESR